MFRSSSKLPWLSGSTRRHFPIREATKDKQLGCRIPHIPSISIIHTICSICVNTTWHHNKTLRLKVFIHKTLKSQILQTWVSWTNIQSIQATSTCGSLTCLGTDNYKWRRLRSLTIYKTLPRAQDRSWGNKLNVEVHAELLVRLKSLCTKHKIGKREYKCTQQDLHQNFLHMLQYQ